MTEAPGGGRARSLYATPPPGFERKWVGGHGANGAQFFLCMLPFHQTIHALSARLASDYHIHPSIPPNPQTHIPPGVMHVGVVGRVQPPPPPPRPNRQPPPPQHPPANPRPQLPHPPPQVLTDSWGVGRIRTGCSRPPGDRRFYRRSGSQREDIETRDQAIDTKSHDGKANTLNWRPAHATRPWTRHLLLKDAWDVLSCASDEDNHSAGVRTWYPVSQGNSVDQLDYLHISIAGSGTIRHSELSRRMTEWPVTCPLLHGPRTPSTPSGPRIVWRGQGLEPTLSVGANGAARKAFADMAAALAHVLSQASPSPSLRTR